MAEMDIARAWTGFKFDEQSMQALQNGMRAIRRHLDSASAAILDKKEKKSYTASS